MKVEYLSPSPLPIYSSASTGEEGMPCGQGLCMASFYVIRLWNYMNREIYANNTYHLPPSKMKRRIPEVILITSYSKLGRAGAM